MVRSFSIREYLDKHTIPHSSIPLEVLAKVDDSVNDLIDRIVGAKLRDPLKVSMKFSYTVNGRSIHGRNFKAYFWVFLISLRKHPRTSRVQFWTLSGTPALKNSSPMTTPSFKKFRIMQQGSSRTPTFLSKTQQTFSKLPDFAYMILHFTAVGNFASSKVISRTELSNVWCYRQMIVFQWPRGIASRLRLPLPVAWPP